MHRLAATPGGWDNTKEGVIYIEQAPAPIVLLTAADTDISTLNQVLDRLPKGFEEIRALNLLQLQQQLTIDTYAETVLRHARVIIVRILGGRSYWSYGLEVLKETVSLTGASLIVMPGDDKPDLDLMSHSTVALSVVNRLWQYFTEGGIDNLCYGLMYASDCTLSTNYNPSSPQAVAKVGIYTPTIVQETKKKTDTKGYKKSDLYTDIQVKLKSLNSLQSSQKTTSKLTFENISNLFQSISNLTDESSFSSLSDTKLFNKSEDFSPFKSNDRILLPSLEADSRKSKLTALVGVIFYRAHYLSGDTKTIDMIAAALAKRNLVPVPIYVSSLKELEVQQAILRCCQSKDGHQSIDLVLNTTSFAITSFQQTSFASAALKPSTSSTSSLSVPSLWQQLDIPVLQVICSGSSHDYWQSHTQGLTPRDIAMNVALPEVDGRVITRAVSFKGAEQEERPEGCKALRNQLQTDVVAYQAKHDRIDFVADLALKWVQLRRVPVQDRKVALILANYPNRDGRMANGVGLDTPASCLEILRSLQQAGYTVTDLPKTGDDLMARLAAGVTNDPEGFGLVPIDQSLSLESYQSFFQTLSSAVQAGITSRWGEPRIEWQRFNHAQVEEIDCLPISGIQFGNIFVGIQPSRGYDIDPTLNYHAPDLAPTHAYLGFYHWLRAHFSAQAIVHVGKHGNLEWLPGKGIALSSDCYPEAAFGPVPHFYPFIVNDPGEGAQAKRRASAVILDHLTPPMTRAELYGPLQQLESLVDEYYEAQNLDPTRLKIIGPKIVDLLLDTQLQQDLKLSMIQTSEPPIDSQPLDQSPDLQTWLPQIDGYLCELKEAQIRDGLHILGQCPTGNQLRDLIVAIARHPNAEHLGLSRAIAQSWGLDLDPLTEDLGTAHHSTLPQTRSCRTIGDVVEQIEIYAADLVGQLLDSDRSFSDFAPPLKASLCWIADTLLPNLRQTTQELTHLLHGLEGGYVPSGPAGAPTRNRPEVLPTGRNFYSVDIRAIPTESAWDVGRKAAEILVENYTQEQGEYPRTLGLSMWGTAAMRTGGDDIAEALALLGVRPVWDGPSRRVVDFEILPLASLGRPRVDVTLRISGFFRDAFPNLISLFDQAVIAVSKLDESAEQNPLAAQAKKEYEQWQAKGLDHAQSLERSRYRIFGSKPGAYGAGLQGLIEAQNWESDADLARAYINWSGYAYTGNADGHSALEAFSQRLENMQIVLQNQDNREHDLLDSDDYYQFQGGLTAAVKAKRGESPLTYFGDNAVPENPKVRSLQSEIARVYRSRVINPKWIKGVMRHGYKGAFELAATVDYLFAYDATTGCVSDHMYKGVAEAYVLDLAVGDFVRKSNPWALRDMAERLLEASQRGLWKGADEKMVDELRAIAHTAEGTIEAGLSTTAQRSNPS
ncbi:cobaltochelatase, CobN subunit [Synechococcus sp. PCC 7335]|uniref:cobaltochelatase subunit CobN n=1 Tax=Synechococcus sp. (strain ATCC 29403 / PCC 7335) TaxID=91464 RepID=UPI00017ED550|nr:cobaltochelatase subunit CobN [Synechococcus sp. PCC 7335]EDX85140.1 cobaltochelatase, CobN subunit [Synechococcus sp. PCC 7335]